jgi:hypothetical protein
MRLENSFRAPNSIRYCLLIVVLICSAGLTGCSKFESHSYGAIESESRTSLNGLGVHKKMWEQVGVKCLAPKRLSRRLDEIDVIVLVSQSFDPPGKAARQWLEDWLKSKAGRTLVYFGRDFNAEQLYLEKTLPTVPDEDSPLVRQRLSIVRAGELQNRLESYTENTFCGWFYLDTQLRSEEVGSFEGPWAEDLETNDSTWPLRTRLMPPKKSYRLNPPSWITNPPPPTAPGAIPTPPVAKNANKDKVISRSRWEASELNSVEQWDAEFKNLMESQVLLRSSNNDPLVFELTNSRRIGQSKIIVVANGAPFLNGSLVDPLFGKVSEKIINKCLPARRAAILGFDDSGLQISAIGETDSRGLGVEMLVEWPLSAVTIPAALLGIVICVYLLPILGRPKQLRERSVSDFGMHVEAMGQLLRDAGDHAYAHRTIVDYFQRVRGEAPPSWLVRPSENRDKKP